MKLLFRTEIPGRVCIKKNSTRRVYAKGRLITLASERYLDWQKMAVSFVERERVKARIATPIACKLFAKYYFHFKNRQAEPDTSNCVEGPQDVLTRAGVIVDDKQIWSFYAEKDFGLEPKTIIELYAAEEIALAV